MLKFTAGDQFRTFNVYGRKVSVDASGHTLYSKGELQGTVKAAAYALKPEAAKRGRQLEHTTAYSLIVRGRCGLKPGDILERDDMHLYVRWVRDVGLMGMYSVIMCDLRKL